MGVVEKAGNLTRPERKGMPTIVKRAASAGATLICPDATVLEIARLLSEDSFTADDAVEETMTSAHATRGEDGSNAVNSDVYRVLQAVKRHATRPGSVPDGKVLRTAKRLEEDAATTGRVTVAFYWGDPPKRAERPTLTPTTVSEDTTGS